MDAFVQPQTREASPHQDRSVRERDQSVLDYLHDIIGSDLKETNRVILDRLDSQVPLIPELGSHLINSGGKRLRPILTLLATRMFGYRGEQHYTLAAVVEFIHTATLLHDDVVDESLTRRGRQTANAVWGSKAPVLVGDFLFSRAFQMLVEHGDLRVLEIIADACAVISEGEVMQLLVSNNLETSESQYMEVVSRKTATLFAAAARIGAVLNHRSVDEEERLARYGLLLGQAYQVVDDTLDYSATRETLGKGIGDDFQEGKITLPLIHAFHHGSEEERRFWTRCIEAKDQPEGSLERAIDLVRQRGSLDYAMARARSLAEAAVEAADCFPASRERDALIRLATFSVDRHH
ncbi:MAG: polyprenyl synthetase family protein [Magnetococcales bacterium]|nr:polyprenyl synthetase family protein [Magnetococcales bacterium]MBF0151093.1 polyprenyl synthetase family protein [Magnetococcales bacterium]MBF0174506.1 polyprenyl synthetase family protein [Magnetococcales bacterium]MBF0348459.1 polyprenyl synthetase family protein [Magnetococcales bacterium]MBF0632519.1 polyprenyl synthetase family protein [Magnetococcales bacterium]